MSSLSTTVGILNLLGDATRIRLLSVLASAELTVAQLTRVLDLPQPRVSTHLGKLREAGLVRDRKQGASTHYRASDPLPEPTRSLWQSLAGAVDDEVLAGDERRAKTLLEEDRASNDWIDAVAGEMDRHYSPGRTWAATARGLTGLLRLGDVLDVGSGDGAITELLAPRAESVTCLDRSERMLDGARRRLKHFEHARFAHGDMHEMPFEAERFDHALLFNVLTYSHAPAQVLAETARVLRAGGALSIVTLDRHAHRDVTEGYRHINDGFAPADLERLLREAGFEVGYCDVTSRETRTPFFRIVTAFASRGDKRGPSLS